jgi:hypothetical protein
MNPAASSLPGPRPSRLGNLILPKEHGSWSLAFEPVALGLLAAPSPGGGWLAVAVAAAFFARRPLRIACRDADPERRASAWAALGICTLVAASALGATVAVAGLAWIGWLAPTALAGAIFLSFDLRNAGRAELAEVTGAAAFGFLPAAFAVLAGWSAFSALALAVLMLGRTVPTVLGVRAFLRASKTGEWHPGPALAAAGVALLTGLLLHRAGLVSGAAVVLLALLAIRSAMLLVYPRPVLRPGTVGMIEAVAGVVFVVAVGTMAG